MKTWIASIIAAAGLALAAPTMAQDEAEEDEDAGPPPEAQLFGSYDFPPYTFTFEDTLIYRVNEADVGEIARGRYLVFDNVLLIADMGGPQACPVSPAGKYFWAPTDDGVAFLMVRDNCAGRQDRLGAETYVPPEDDEAGS